MASIVVSGDVSGTVTLSAPSAAGTTTLTLPTTTGTVLASNSATTLNSGSSAMTLQTNGTTAVTIDTSQNVGIGVTPSAWSAGKSFEVGGVGNTVWGQTGDMSIGQGFYYSAGYKYALTGSAPNFLEMYNGAFIFRTAASGTAGNAITWTQAMTLDSSGNLSVGATSNGQLVLKPESGSAYLDVGHITGTASGYGYSIFRYNATVIGRIDQNGTTAVSYNTTSDYRLKENIAPMTGALDKVALLKPVTYTWKSDGSDGQGFIAHELQAVVPDCVTGDKDAVDEDGNPEYQGVDTSFLVATLTAAIQELTARVKELEAKVK